MKRRESSFEDESKQTSSREDSTGTSKSQKRTLSEKSVNTPPCTPPRKQRKRVSLSPSSQQITNELRTNSDNDLPVEHNGKYST